MHPAIRIVCFLLFGALLATGGYPELGVAVLLLLLSYSRFSRADLMQGLRLVRRIRWLLLSVFLIYLIFTPGTPWLDATPFWLPTREAVQQGLLRMMILATLVLAVNLLLRSTNSAELIGALLWLFKPLAWLGDTHERLAVRLALTLQVVTDVQLLQNRQGTPPAGNEGEKPGLHRRVQAFGQRAGDLFGAVLAQAQTAPTPAIELHQTPIPHSHWLWPAVLLGAFLLPEYLA